MKSPRNEAWKIGEGGLILSRGFKAEIMKILNFHEVLAVSLLLLAATAPLRAEDAPDPLALEQEHRLKEDTEKRAQEICDSILGKDRSNVLASVELALESVRKGGSAVNQKLDKKGGLPEENFLLPWVPAPKSVTKEEAPKDANVETQAAQQATIDVKTVIRRFDVTVLYDKTIPEERVAMAKEALKSAFDRYKNVLKLFFQPTSFVSTNDFDAKKVVTRNLWDFLTPKNLIFLFLLLLALQLLRFFFGPLADFMKNYIDGMREQSKAKVEMLNQSETESENESGENEAAAAELTPEEQAALEAEEEAMQKFVPFRYVNDDNIKQLAYLLHHEEPWIVALVISYLSAQHAYKVMEALPADLHAKVALETALYRQTSLEQVVAIDEDIKQKIDFVVGGLDKLVVILESSDRFARDNIFEYLKNEKPAIYERVREHILLFEDIVNFPKIAMQTIVRELKTEQLARALRGASPELQQKFFESMSQGAVTLLKEEMEYGRPVTDEQVEEDRRKIVDLIKAMETDGKVAFRTRGKIATLQGDELGSERSGLKMDAILGTGKPNPAEAAAAYNAAVAATEQGNTEEALRQFEMSVRLDPTSAAAYQGLANTYYGLGRYQEALHAFDGALALEPNEELRKWVEELRASLSAAA